MRYREVEKLRSTYGEGLISEVAADGRIHATFNQTVARTGRLSSDAPNLHNIPVRSEEGRRFREAFVPAEGYEFIVADYNQIELRVIAHLAEDPGLIEAFTTGEDIHSTTAARIFGVDAADVTHAQRSKSKMVSYGLAYGMEAYGLGQRLGIPTGEAQEILDAYFVAFPSVKALHGAHGRGGPRTRLHRDVVRTPPPDPGARLGRANVRMAGERQAMNAGIQGLAADIFKVALVRLDAALDESDLRSRLILQVHDEVILEVPPEESERADEVVLDAMSSAFDLRVPLEVNLSHGSSWAQRRDERRTGGRRVSAPDRHWFEDIADHVGPAYLRYSFTMGTEQEVSFLIEELGLTPGMTVLDVGCGPGRHCVALARRGIRSIGVDISERFVTVARELAEREGVAELTEFHRADARAMVGDPRIDASLRPGGGVDAAISLCQGAFGLGGGTTPDDPQNLAPDSAVLNGIRSALVPGGRAAVSAFSSYFQVRWLEDQDSFDAASAVNHEHRDP